MKIRKNAEQKNFIVNKDFYTEYELLSMARQKTIFCIDEFLTLDISQILDKLKIVVLEYLQICVKK